LRVVRGTPDARGDRVAANSLAQHVDGLVAHQRPLQLLTSVALKTGTCSTVTSKTLTQLAPSSRTRALVVSSKMMYQPQSSSQRRSARAVAASSADSARCSCQVSASCSGKQTWKRGRSAVIWACLPEYPSIGPCSLGARGARVGPQRDCRRAHELPA